MAQDTEIQLMAAVVFLSGITFATGLLMLASFIDPQFLLPQKPVNPALYGAFTGGMALLSAGLAQMAAKSMNY